MFKRQTKIRVFADDRFWLRVEVDNPTGNGPLNLTPFTVTAFAAAKDCQIDLSTRVDDAPNGIASVRIEGIDPGTYALRMDVDDGASNQIVLDQDLEVLP